MLRFFRLRYILLYILLFVGYTHFDARWIFERPVAHAISSYLKSIGFKDSTFQIVSLTFSNITIETIKLDSESINTIDKIHVTYSPLGLIFGRVKDINITKPDFIFSADSRPNLSFISSKAENSPHRPFLLSTLPFQSLNVTDLSLAYAGDDINPGVTGNITLKTNDRGDKELSFHMIGAQKDLSLNITGTMTESPDKTIHLNLEIPEARFDIPNILMMSRAHGNFDITIPNDSPLSANGEWVAGAMRIGTIPLDNISLVIQGRKPDFSLIGNADITGLPQSNISLRLADDANGAQLIAQISGNSPQKLFKVMVPKSSILLPERQKFVITLDLKDKDLSQIFTAPYDGAVFIYDDQAAPFISVSLNCPTGYFDCKITASRTALSTRQMNAFLEPVLADNGLILESGDITVNGHITPFSAPVPLYDFQIASNNMAINWQGLPLSNLNFNITRDQNGSIDSKPGSAYLMDGQVSTTSLHLSPDGNGLNKAEINKIDLALLSQFVRIDGLDVSGRATGTVPIRFKSWIPAFDQGGKIEGFKGGIKYSPSTYPGFLAGNSEQIKILRDTLQDYTFDSLNLNFAGDPMGTVKATLAAKGRNESLFQDRPIHINLNIDGPLAPAIKQLIPYFGGGEDNSEQDQTP